MRSRSRARVRSGAGVEAARLERGAGTQRGGAARARTRPARAASRPGEFLGGWRGGPRAGGRRARPPRLARAAARASPSRRAARAASWCVRRAAAAGVGGGAGDAHARAQPLWTSDAWPVSRLLFQTRIGTARSRAGGRTASRSTPARVRRCGERLRSSHASSWARVATRCQQPPPPTPAEALSRVCWRAPGRRDAALGVAAGGACQHVRYTSGYNGSVGARDSDAGAPEVQLSVSACRGHRHRTCQERQHWSLRNALSPPGGAKPVKPPKAGAREESSSQDTSRFDHIFSMGLPHLADTPVASGPAALDERERVARGKGLRERVQMDALSARAIADHVGSRVTSDATRLAAMHAAAVAAPTDGHCWRRYGGHTRRARTDARRPALRREESMVHQPPPCALPIARDAARRFGGGDPSGPSRARILRLCTHEQESLREGAGATHAFQSNGRDGHCGGRALSHVPRCDVADGGGKRGRSGGHVPRAVHE